MRRACRVLVVLGLLASLSSVAQVSKARKIVLPNPQLIHCRAVECSQLWKPASGDGALIYPAHVMTDLVNGEIVGLTAVYDKSVSENELRAGIDALYKKWSLRDMPIWRVETEQVAISIADGSAGAKEVIYLKFGTYESHVPSAHIYDCKNCRNQVAKYRDYRYHLRVPICFNPLPSLE